MPPSLKLKEGGILIYTKKNLRNYFNLNTLFTSL